MCEWGRNVIPETIIDFLFNGGETKELMCIANIAGTLKEITLIVAR